MNDIKINQFDKEHLVKTYLQSIGIYHDVDYDDYEIIKQETSNIANFVEGAKTGKFYYKCFYSVQKKTEIFEREGHNCTYVYNSGAKTLEKKYPEYFYNNYPNFLSCRMSVPELREEIDVLLGLLRKMEYNIMKNV